MKTIKHFFILMPFLTFNVLQLQIDNYNKTTSDSSFGAIINFNTNTTTFNNWFFYLISIVVLFILIKNRKEKSRLNISISELDTQKKKVISEQNIHIKKK